MYLVTPDRIIEQGGIILLVAIVFAETGLLVGFFLPGDSLLFVAGLTVGMGRFGNVTIYEILIYTSIAAVAGDQFGYYIGNRYGSAIFNKKESLFFKPEYVVMTKNFYDRHGGSALVLGRFLPIIRTFAPVFAGVVKLEYNRFVFYNVFGGILWVFSLCLIGYFLGGSFPWLKEYLELIVIGIIIISTIPVIRTVLKERKLAKERAVNDQERLAEHQKMLEEIESQRNR
jgi:membrane-associated protein